MNDEVNNDSSQGAADLGDLSSFFAPSWAKDEGDSQVKLVSGRDRNFEEERPRRNRDGRPRRDGDRPRRDDRPRDGERPRRDDNRQRRDGDRPRPRRDERPVREAPLALSVRFLPEGKSLEVIIRRIVTSHKAYPFRDIVRLFQKDDASLSVRIEADRSADPAAKVYQCRACGMPALTEAEAIEHIFSTHLADYFDIETVECEAPTGNFPCVARCGLTGELLGPPNHHSYSRKIAEMLQDRFPGMSRDEYCRKIEMVRDKEAIEEWRNAAKMQTKYFRKIEEVEPAKDAEPASAEGEGAEASEEAAAEAPIRVGMLRADAEALFRAEILPELLVAAPHVVCSAAILKNMPNRRLAAYLNREFNHDDVLRSQGTLSKALHAAFHHRKLHFFHANDDHGQEFVIATAPVVFDTENVTDEIRTIVNFVTENPSCTEKALLDAVVPDGNEEAVKRVMSSIRWLVEKGHLVEYFNNLYSIAAPHPIYRLTPKKERKPKDKPADENSAPSADAETPAGDDAAQAPKAEDAPVVEESVVAEAAPAEETSAEEPVATEEASTAEETSQQ